MLPITSSVSMLVTRSIRRLDLPIPIPGGNSGRTWVGVSAEFCPVLRLLDGSDDGGNAGSGQCPLGGRISAYISDGTSNTILAAELAGRFNLTLPG